MDYAPPAETTRILVLGDSYTFAEQVDQERTFVQLLENRLNQSVAGGRFQVLNAGSNGWSTANELSFLLQEGLRYRPDIVVVAFYVGNDVAENYRRVSAVRDAGQDIARLPGTDRFAGLREILRRSKVYSFIESGVLAKLAPASEQDEDETEGAFRPAPRSPEQIDEAWKITEQLLEQMRQVCERQHIRMVLMVVPTADQVGAANSAVTSQQGGVSPIRNAPTGLDTPQSILAEIAQRKSLELLDLLPVLRAEKARSNTRLYFRTNAHWTAESHDVAATQLQALLTREALLKPVR